uniref:Uncharacterized protein n=1 Tax=Tetranychus urticae TaxID=32264 RepID=T1L5X5_TETUR
MAKRPDYPHKITFKVKHLDEYHDIVLDWDVDKYRYKSQQIFDQVGALESITGVPSRYTSSFYIPRPDEVNLADTLGVSYNNLKAFTPDLKPELDKYDYRQDDTSWRIFRDGERYRLTYWAYYSHRVSKRISMGYGLVNEIYVTDGVCSQDFCQYQCTESRLKMLQDLVSNDELNAKITPLVQPIMETFEYTRYAEASKILREFNVEQFLCLTCVEQRREVIQQNGHERQDDLYERTRG